jgi:hypothetical protein
VQPQRDRAHHRAELRDLTGENGRANKGNLVAVRDLRLSERNSSSITGLQRRPVESWASSRPNFPELLQ